MLLKCFLKGIIDQTYSYQYHQSQVLSFKRNIFLQSKVIQDTREKTEMPLKVWLLIAEDSQNHLECNDAHYVTSYVAFIFFYILFIAKLQRSTF